MACVSDLHGYLPVVPPCDVLVIAGDICPATNHDIEYQRLWLRTIFRRWLDRVPATNVVATWGNHDWIGQKAPQDVPELRWHLLVDRGCEVDGMSFYGTPWQPEFMDWAFNANESGLAKVFSAIPRCDVLVSHGPPYGACDTVTQRGVHLGSIALASRIGHVQPRLVVCGHIHGGYGEAMIGETRVLNVAHVDERYRPVHPPVVIEMPPTPERTPSP